MRMSNCICCRPIPGRQRKRRKQFETPATLVFKLFSFMSKRSFDDWILSLATVNFLLFNTVYETTFRYLLSPTELKFRELELVIATRHLFYNILYGTSSNIGRVSRILEIISPIKTHVCIYIFQVKISLDDADIATGGTTKFYDILPQNILYDQTHEWWHWHVFLI